MRYSLEEALNLDIKEIIENEIPLKKKGPNYVGICPFHNDTKPSLTVNPEKGIWKCFACGAPQDGKNQLTNFIMNYKNMNFEEAMEYIGEKYHLTPMAGRNPTEENEYIKTLEKTSVLFEAKLEEHPEILSWLNNDLNLSLETIKKFRIGYAENDIQTLLESNPEFFTDNFKERDEYVNTSGKTIAKKEKPTALQAAQKIGLISQVKQNGETSTFFNIENSLTIPVFNEYGKIIGFHKITKPGEVFEYNNIKYSLNHILFNNATTIQLLDLARKAIKKTNTTYITDNILDAIILNQNNIDNVISIPNFELSDNHIATFKELKISKIYLIPSRDETIGENLNTFFMNIPQDIDIDIINIGNLYKKSIFELDIQLQQSANYLEYKINQIKETESSQLLKIQETLKLLFFLRNNIILNHYIEMIKDLYNLPTIDIIKNEFKYEKEKYINELINTLIQKSDLEEHIIYNNEKYPSTIHAIIKNIEELNEKYKVKLEVQKLKNALRVITEKSPQYTVIAEIKPTFQIELYTIALAFQKLKTAGFDSSKILELNEMTNKIKRELCNI